MSGRRFFLTIIFVIIVGVGGYKIWSLVKKPETNKEKEVVIQRPPVINENPNPPMIQNGGGGSGGGRVYNLPDGQGIFAGLPRTYGKIRIKVPGCNTDKWSGKIDPAGESRVGKSGDYMRDYTHPDYVRQIGGQQMYVMQHYTLSGRKLCIALDGDHKKTYESGMLTPDADYIEVKGQTEEEEEAIFFWRRADLVIANPLAKK